MTRAALGPLHKRKLAADTNDPDRRIAAARPGQLGREGAREFDPGHQLVLDAVYPRIRTETA
jgi:hypothetical protein